jgi:methionine-R-sulfoxide reductase
MDTQSMFFASIFACLVPAALACSNGQAENQQGQPMTKTETAPLLSKSGYDLRPLSKERIAEIVKTLTPIQVEVTQRAGTERPNSSPLADNKEKGVYVSVVSGLPLFRSSDKFESGTGWPSFTRPFDPAHVIERRDGSLGVERVELVDARSGAHLGHVFDDGPKPTGLRYCINSASLRFIPLDQLDAQGYGQYKAELLRAKR